MGRAGLGRKIGSKRNGSPPRSTPCPSDDEEVLRAKYLDGFSVAEIAAKWNETPKAVESLFGRAREKFRKLYDR